VPDPQLEFTGERIVPGQVNADLFHEHMARYAFACRLARQKRVLDAACGAGYGSAALATHASFVAAFDLSPEAVLAARQAYSRPNLAFIAARAEQIPFRDGAFDLVVAFEVIEHLEDWRALLAEARRLLAPGGQFIVSTPNRLFYAESRALAGPNPYHVHEFDFAEFRAALEEFFPSTAIYLQNHSGAITFSPLSCTATAAAELAAGAQAADPETSHFFVAVCAAAHQTGAPLYVYLPSSSNVLRERETHIRKLESELRQKDAWLDELQSAHAALQTEHDATLAELRQRNEWAQALEAELQQARQRILQLQGELEELHRAAQQQIDQLETDFKALAADHQANLEELARCVKLLDEAEARVTERTRWAQQLEQELADCVKLLDDAEARVIERTQWAQALDARLQEMEHRLGVVRASRWVRLGRRLGVGPQVE
jgi:SAM-dependent methyltransferase